jgi:hypothetical protein
LKTPVRLDPEIDEVEARIVRRREALARIARESEQRAKDTARRAVHKLTSPGALAGAAVIGFLVGGRAVRQHREPKVSRSGRRRNDPAGRSAKRTGMVGALMTGAMWLVRARFGSPAGLANYIMARRRGATSAAASGAGTSGRPSFP